MGMCFSSRSARHVALIAASSTSVMRSASSTTQVPSAGGAGKVTSARAGGAASSTHARNAAIRATGRVYVMSDGCGPEPAAPLSLPVPFPPRDYIGVDPLPPAPPAPRPGDDRWEPSR